MKNITYLLTFFISIILISCETTGNRMNPAFSNQQQADFDAFLAKNKKLYFAQGNSIQEKEFMNNFEHELFKYVDSVKLFVNWKGKIKEINTKEVGKNTTSIEFEIYYNPESYREVTFNCLYVTSTDSLKNNPIYNKVKNISDYSTVYFDGFIRTRRDSTVKYEYRKAGDHLNLPYPKYDFFIIDIGTEKRSDSLSVNLQQAIDIACEFMETLSLEYNKKISAKEKKERVKKLTPKSGSIKSDLTDEEGAYIDRFAQALLWNFQYAD